MIRLFWRISHTVHSRQKRLGLAPPSRIVPVIRSPPRSLQEWEDEDDIDELGESEKGQNPSVAFWLKIELVTQEEEGSRSDEDGLL